MFKNGILNFLLRVTQHKATLNSHPSNLEKEQMKVIEKNPIYQRAVKNAAKTKPPEPID